MMVSPVRELALKARKQTGEFFMEAIAERIKSADATTRSKAQKDYRALVVSGQIEERSEEEVRELLATAGFTPDNLDADQLAVSQHARLTADLPTDDTVADANSALKPAMRRLEAAELELTKARSGLDEACRRDRVLTSKQSTVRAQISQLKRQHPRLF